MSVNFNWNALELFKMLTWEKAAWALGISRDNQVCSSDSQGAKANISTVSVAWALPMAVHKCKWASKLGR